MSDKRLFNLVHQEARRRAAQAVAEAPEGWRVTIEPPKRNLDQNALLWVLLTCFSEQLKWPVNGAMVQLTPDEWKDVLTAAYRNDAHRIAQGLNGGMVILGMKTSQMGKREFAEFIEFIQSVAVDRGVKLEQQAERAEFQRAEVPA
jgi:hypothetical protein